MGVNDFINIGEKIKTARIAAGYKQKDFAKKLEIPVSTLANYEGGKREPNSEMIAKIASKLNISVNELFSLENTTKQGLGTLADFFNDDNIIEFYNSPSVEEYGWEYIEFIEMWQELINKKKRTQYDDVLLKRGQNFINCFRSILLICGKNELAALSDYMLSEILLSADFDKMLDYIQYITVSGKLTNLSGYERKKNKNTKEGE